MVRNLLSVLRQLLDVRTLERVSVHRKLSCSRQTPDAGPGWTSRGRCRPAPLLAAAPARALVDEDVSVRGAFLPPHRPVTLRAQLRSEDGDLWEASAHYEADADGTVDVARDHSVGGSYLGCEPMGLFWGLQPAPGAREGLRLRKRDVSTPYVVTLSLLEGHVAPGEAESRQLAAVTTERWYVAPGVQRTDVRHNGLIGTLFLPPGPGPFPAMLDLWGMGGGLVEYRSALFASRGYASLSLAYLHKDLPGAQTRVGVGDAYFKSAFRLLQSHPQVCADRVGIVGLSFGVYLSLRLAAQSGVEPSCLVCINGPVGSTSKLADADGRTEDFNENQEKWTYDAHGRVSFKEVSSPANLPPESRVKLDNLSCPLMFIVGEDDLSSSSIENADLVEDTLRAAGKSELFTRLSYPGAGHLIEPPYSPNARVSLWTTKPHKLFTMWGGHPTPHAAAQKDSWKRILDFMETNLRR